MPVLADNISRLFAATIKPDPNPGVQFPGIVGRTRLITIPTRFGDTPATVYLPEPTPGGKPGVYVNVHGGGFVVGNRDQDDPWCRYLAAHAGVVVINIDYVLAPKYRFPAPVEQVYDVLVWVAARHDEWDGTRLCVGGQSAGGSLSAAAARMALESGGPTVALQVLHYPPLDLVTSTADKHSEKGLSAVLKPWMGEVFDAAYIPDRAQRRHRFASPAWGCNADGIDGIAPALIVTAEYDRLRAEAETYAGKLAAVGALAEYHEVAGVDHGYNIMTDNVEVTARVYDVICRHVRGRVGLED
ncbi:MAG: carboxylesterase [Mycobacterium sp.]|nr:carboxylesterase [Mycobacterium sp.]